MKLVNLANNQLEMVEEGQVENLILSGQYGFQDGLEVPVMENSSGEMGYLPPLEAIKEMQSGNYTFISPREMTEIGLQDKYGGPGEMALTALQQTAEGVTAGLSKYALIKSGLADPKEYSERALANPIIAGMGQVGGTLLGLKVPYSPIRFLDEMGKGVAKPLKPAFDKAFRSGLNKKIAELAVRGSAEASAFRMGDLFVEAGLGNADLNAEAIGHAIKGGLKDTALLLGGGVGAYKLGKGALNAGKSLKKIGSKLKKASGVDETAGGLRLNVTGKDLKKTELSSDVGGRGIEFSFDPESNTYKYSDSVKEVYLDPEKVKGKILSFADVDEMNDIGDRLGIENLADKFNKEYKIGEQGFIDFIINKRLEVYENYAKDAETFARGSVKNQKQMDQLSQGWRRLRAKITELESRPQTPVVKKQLKSLKSKEAGLFKNFKKLSGKRKQFDELKTLTPEAIRRQGLAHAVEDVEKVIDRYDAIKFRNRFVIKNPGVIDDAIRSSITRFSGKTKDISFSDEKTIKAIGADKGFFRKAFRYKTNEQIAELASFIRKNFRSGVNNRLINHPVLTDLDDLMVNVDRSESLAIDKMNTAINRAEDYLISNKIKTNLTGDKVATHIAENFYNKYINPRTGNPIPGAEKTVEGIKKHINSWRKYNISEDGVQIPFDVEEFRKLRIDIDNFKPLWEGSETVEKQLLRSVRNKMESMIMDQLSKYDEGGSVLKMYKEGKKEYGLAQDTWKLLENQFAKESANNAFGLTSYISGGILAGAGGGILGGPTGAILGMGVRELTRSYGDNLLALYADAIFDAQNKLAIKIDNSIKNFVKAPTGKISIPLSRATGRYNPYEEFEKELDLIEKGQYDFRKFTEDFIDNNQLFMNSMPKTSDSLQRFVQQSYAMLIEKMPKNPYQNSPMHVFRPPDTEIRKFLRYKEAILNPDSIYKEISSGHPSNEAIEVLRRLHPQSMEVIQYGLMKVLASEKNVGFKKRAQIKRLFGIQTDHYQRPDNMMILQQAGKSSRMDGDKQLQPQPGKAPKGMADSRKTTGQRMSER